MMSTVHLSNFNNSFRVENKHDHTVLVLSKVVFILQPGKIVHPSLSLQVVDEHELPLFSELLAPLAKKEGDETVAYIQQEFSIWQQLHVRLITHEPDIEFEVELYFTFK